MIDAVKFLLSVGVIAGGTAIAACSSAPTPPDLISPSDTGGSGPADDAGARSTSDSGTSACAASTTCAAPPATKCVDSTTLRTYAASGSCVDGSCNYLYTDAKCSSGCSGNACNGDDPCNGVVCNSPPSGSCTSTTELISYAASGTCSAGSCSYTKSTTTCACDSGACKTYGPAAQVDVYDVAACALTSTGKVMCWGSMLYNDMGSAPTVDPAFASLNVTAVSVGDDAICVLTSAGGVKCTGNEASGALGTSQVVTNGIDFSTAYDVAGLSSGVTEISCGDAFCCARTSTGGAKCWGYNASGQIGNNSKVSAATPVDVSGLTSNVISVVAGKDHACALLSSGGIECWGANDSGQLGNGGTTASLVPVAVTGLSSGVASISAGYSATCAVTTGGAVKCWGVNSPADAVSNNSWGSVTPAAIPSLDSGVANASAGGFLFGSCSVSTGGTVKCWVYDTTELSPFTELTSAATVSAGWDFACALTTTGGIRCFGDDSKGQLGNGATSTSEESDQTPVGFP